MTPVLLASVVAASLALSAPHARPADFASDLQTAMTPYYGALVSSARGDAESTQRHLALFEAQWRKVAAQSATAPAGLTGDPEWAAMIAKVNGFIARGQDLLHARDVHAAHREIEGIRLVLYGMRQRHGLETLDDRLTEYHESMERIVTRASMYNEIILNDADYAEMARDLGKANAIWPRVEVEAGTIAQNADWKAAARQSAIARDELARLVAARDDAAITRAAEKMKDAYLDLLSVMARVAR